MTQRNRYKRAPASGADLRKLRESAGLSRAELADRSGYTSKTIDRWECGEGTPRRAVMELLRNLHQTPSYGRQDFRFIDLFAGIGGTRKGFERVGGECVFTSEWDRHSQITYRANFGAQHPIAGDVTKISSDVIPAHDVLLAGFPCKPFSIAGVSKKNALGHPHGFACEAQGTLFFEVARVIRDLRPKAFMLENVKNLTTHDGGRTFRTIMKVLEDELGYHVSPKVVDARAFVPQHRERIILVGFADSNSFSWNDVAIPKGDEGPRLGSILHPEDGSENPEEPFTDRNGKVNKKYYLTDNLWQYLQNYAVKHKAKGNGFGFGLVGPEDVTRTLSARYYKDGSEILIRTSRKRNPRRLTPRECARLMGFDREGEPAFSIEVSDTQAYRQFGNSVVVPVVQAVAKAMRPFVVGGGAERLQLSLPLQVRGE